MRPFRYKRKPGQDKQTSVVRKDPVKITYTSKRRGRKCKSKKTDGPTIKHKRQGGFSKDGNIENKSEINQDEFETTVCNIRKSHFCTVCHQSFSGKKNLAHHMYVHSEEAKFTCGFCGKKLRSRSGLDQHLNVHTGIKPFKCEVPNCGKTFVCNANLTKHARVHSDEKPYVCEVCEQGFKRNQSRKDHMANKHGKGVVKKYECEVCGRTFSQKVHMKQHVNVHIDAKPHKCSYDSCNKAFSNRSNLIKHERIHSGVKPYECDICGEKFSRKDYLTGHKTKHTDQKPHVCEICGKGFIQKGNLKIHLRSHTGERPFLCDICGHGFTHKSNRDKHYLQHSEINKMIKRGRKRKSSNEEILDSEEFHDKILLQQEIMMKTERKETQTAPFFRELLEVAVENSRELKASNQAAEDCVVCSNESDGLDTVDENGAINMVKEKGSNKDIEDHMKNISKPETSTTIHSKSSIIVTADVSTVTVTIKGGDDDDMLTEIDPTDKQTEPGVYNYCFHSLVQDKCL